MKEIHEQIKAIRKAKGLTQEVVANVLNIKKANLSRIESGDIKLSDDKLETLATFFGMSIEEIVAFESIQEKIKKGGQKEKNEELLEQQGKQIERMQRNTEEFITALLTFFQSQIDKDKKAGLNSVEKVDTAFEALCKVEGIKYLFNQENLRADFPLLDPFNEYRKEHIDNNLKSLLKQLQVAVKILGV